MNAFDFRLLADENIAPELVLALRDQGTVVCTVHISNHPACSSSNEGTTGY